MWIQRDISETLRAIHSQRPIVLVTGSRQVGKTSLLENTFPDHRRVSLDLPAIAEEAEKSGRQFLDRHPTPVIIDEVQYAPALFRYLKAAVDDRRNEGGLYLLTGSQKFELMQGVAESLAGRVSIVELHSLSLLEIERAHGAIMDRASLLRAMWCGGYPEVVARDLNPVRFYADYVATYLERDVRQALAVRNLRDFDRFLRLCALRTGQLLSMASLASDVGVSPNTIRAWVSVLEASGIIKLVEPYYSNLGKRLVKTPKLYFMDTGLCCFLAGFTSVQTLADSTMLGAMFETAALGQIVRHATNRGAPVSVYFYRDHHGVEVDFVIPIGEKLRLIECKWAETPTEPRAFSELERLAGRSAILSKTILTPDRGRRLMGTTSVEDCVGLSSLD
jgi:uncharacterized protein